MEIPAAAETIHATTVSHNGRALLIRGASGSGKSSLALQLIALGAGLIADDRTHVWRVNDVAWAGCPQALAGLIEARGVGILNTPLASPAQIYAVVDLDAPEETERLPPSRKTDLFGVNVPLYRRSSAAHFAAALLLFLSHGRHA